MLVSLFITASLLVLLAVLFHKREEYWREIEEAYRKRERELIDRLLKTANVKPLEPTIEREKVLKIPDPEVPPPNWIDAAFLEDEIKEEIEQLYPEAAHMSHADAKRTYTADWSSAEARLKMLKAPLRV